MNKTALITGASSGIGAQLALTLAKEGFNIAINTHIFENTIADGEKVAQQCKELGVDAKVYSCDVSDYAKCEEMVKAVKADFGTIDVLVNNAGITKDGLLARMSESQYDDVIAVNQKSVFNMMKFVSGVMIKQKGGKVINIASVAGLHGNAGQFNYSASKGAIISMTKTSAKELGSRNITVNAIAPGMIKTPMTDAMTEEQRERILSAIALKRFGRVEEIANLVAFLASDKADYITGQTIEISGGLTM